MDIAAFHAFLNRLDKSKRVIIQAHDFPDHDAVSASFGLSYLLQQMGYQTELIYNGYIDRISLQNMIELLEIPLKHASEIELTEADKIITVDGCIGEKNVTDMPGLEVAVIDHHQVSAPDYVWYADIRPWYGATASMIGEYFDALHIDLPSEIATALMIGLSVDTANLTRGYCQADIQAFSKFHSLADTELVNKICRNQLTAEELGYFAHMLDSFQMEGQFGFALLPQGCPKNMLGVLSDFVLSVHEVDVAITATWQGTSFQLSMRSECEEVNAGQLIKKVLDEAQIGFGGGHRHMAGGIIKTPPSELLEHPERLFELFKAHIPVVSQPM